MWNITLFIIVLIFNEVFNLWNMYANVLSGIPFCDKLNFFLTCYKNDFILFGLIGIAIVDVIICVGTSK